MSSLNQNQQNKTKSLDEYVSKADCILDSRFLQFAFSSLGKNVEIQLEDGTKGQGKFHTANLDLGAIVLKDFNQGTEEGGVIPTKVIDPKEFVYILASNIEDPPLLNAKKDVFKTDSEISKNKINDQRKLVKWSADDDEEQSTGLVLEELASQGGKWNQFELNEKKFGLTSNFKEEMYTTQLNMDRVSASLLEKAARIEAEIMNSTSDFGNRHIREERGLQSLKEENEDEELAYSSVIRTDSKKESTKVEDDKRPKFFNSKRTVSNPGEAGTPVEIKATTDNKKEKTKETVTSKAKNAEEPRINLLEKTPKSETYLDNQDFKRQVSNVSEETPQSRARTKLSLNANTFVASESKSVPQTTSQEEAKQKEEVRPSFSKQTSLQNEEKKINMSDYSSYGIAKFKVKINDIKRSAVTFFDYAIPEFLKKENPPDPASVNQIWKIAKITSTPTPIPVIKSTPSTQASTPSSKPLNTPTTASLPFVSTGMIPTFGATPNMMMQSHFNSSQMYPGNMGGMVYAPSQKYGPGPGFNSYGQYGNFQSQQFVVNPSDPNFNLGYGQQHSRPSGPPHKNYKGNKN